MTDASGYLYGIIVGSFVPFKFLALVFVGPALLFLIFSWTIVESPLWYIKMGKTEKAKKTLVWLRGTKYNLEFELKELEDLTCGESSLSSKLILMKSKSFHYR